MKHACTPPLPYGRIVGALWVCLDCADRWELTRTDPTSIRAEWVRTQESRARNLPNARFVRDTEEPTP